MRTAGLAIRLSVGSWPRMMLLGGLVAVSLIILLAVSELSRLSSEGLDDAIASDVGAEGTYSVTIPSIGNLDQAATMLTLGTIAEAHGDPHTVISTTYPVDSFDCPPFEQFGSIEVQIVRDAHGNAEPVPFGEGMPADSELCLDGLRIPAEHVFLAGPIEQMRWGSALIIRPIYESALNNATVGPITLRARIVTGAADGERILASAIRDELEDDFERAGIPGSDRLYVNRIDHGPELAEASRGVKAIYGAIGWGVVLLAGAGMSISQLVVVRQRMWLYGLARALGARRRHVVMLVSCDIVLAVVLGLVLSVILGAISQPLVANVAQSAFGVRAQLWHPESIGVTLAALAAILLVAGALPAYRALASDPLDVLEARG